MCTNLWVWIPDKSTMEALRSCAVIKFLWEQTPLPKITMWSINRKRSVYIYINHSPVPITNECTYRFASVSHHHIFHGKEFDDGVFHSQEERPLPEDGTSHWRLVFEKCRSCFTFLIQSVHDVNLKDEIKIWHIKYHHGNPLHLRFWLWRAYVMKTSIRTGTSRR